jgi:uncharacterized membrane protein YccC
MPDMTSYWRISWSAQAAVRALRATIVMPGLFALTFVLAGNLQLALFAVFGSFGALVMTSFGGTRRDKAIAHLGLAVAGSIALVIGTLVSGSVWLAALMTIPVAFAIFFAGIAGPNAASGVTAALLAYVLPVASAGSAATIPDRLAGWWLASAVATAAVLLVSPRSPGDRLRAAAADAAAALSRHLAAAVRGTATPADRAASVAAKHELMTMFSATPYRPTGLAAADQGLAALIHMIEWCASLTCDAMDGHLDLREAAPQDRALLGESAAVLGEVAALLAGRDADPDAGRLWRARSASAAHLRELTGDPATVARRADHAFHAQAIGIAVTAAVGDALIAARRASPEAIAAQRQRWLGSTADPGPDEHPTRGWLPRVAGIIARDASSRSVWFRNSARGAAALAVAVAVAKLSGVQHGFWVVLGTLSVLRTSAASTGATAMRALAGTAAGFIAGAALLIAIGTSPAALWAVLPVAVLVASYSPGTAPFAVGQAAFTVTVVVLFNLLDPAGWRIGLVRIEDVAVGCAVSVVVGILFWPRGASAVVGDNLADAFRCGADYLTDAVRWVLRPGGGHRPAGATSAIAASSRLDDAVRGYLTEQGSKRLTSADLWTLVMAATRLRLTAHSLASLPGTAGADGPGPSRPARPPVPAGAARAGLERGADDLAGFYLELAAAVARPGRGSPAPAALAVPAGLADPAGPAGSGAAGVPPGEPARYLAEALWVGDHLRHLGAHSAALPGPARRLARLRRTPWWRAADR